MITEVVINDIRPLPDWNKYGNIFQCIKEPSLLVIGNGCCDTNTFQGTVITVNKIENTPIGEFRQDWEKDAFQLIPHKISITFIP